MVTANLKPVGKAVEQNQKWSGKIIFRGLVPTLQMRIEQMKAKFLGLTLGLIILTDIVACGPNRTATDQALNLVVSAGYKPTISVPFCNQARKNGTITGNTYLCMVSANGDFIGSGRTWLEQPPIKNFSSGPAIANGLYQAFIYVNSSDPADL